MQHRCDVANCDSILSSFWNLKRHKIDQHQILIISFAIVESHQSSIYSQRLKERRQRTSLRILNVSTFVRRLTVQNSLFEEEIDEAQEIQRNVTFTLTNKDSRANLLFEVEWFEIIFAHLIQVDIESESSTSSLLFSSITQKRKRFFIENRIHQALRREAVLLYDVTSSSKSLRQQKALDWQKRAARDYFANIYFLFLTRWDDVKSTHQRICILVSRQWSSLNSTNLSHSLSSQQLSSSLKKDLTFQYFDHATEFSKAVAWFTQEAWSARDSRGIDLNNLLDDDLWKSKNAFHRCHHRHCLIHTIFETIQMNKDRLQCRFRAELLRESSMNVSSYCEKHHSTCLLQILFMLNMHKRLLIHCSTRLYSQWNFTTFKSIWWIEIEI